MPPVSVQQAFELALRHHQAGRLAEAEALYRQILAAEPNHAEARHFLGVVAHQAGRDDLAVHLIRESIELSPNNAPAHSNLGVSLTKQGDVDGAIAAYRRAIALRPDFPDAYYNLGNMLRERGQFDEAIAACCRALELQPDRAEAHNGLGIALAGKGDLDEAIAAYHRAIELKPGYPEAYNNLGGAFAGQVRLDEAVSAYRRALELRPDYAKAWNNLGDALREQGQLDEAVAAFGRAIQLDPDHAGTHSNLIYALHFHAGSDAGAIAAEQQRWNSRFGDPLKPLIRPHSNDCNPVRRLRIGYVSPYFQDHVVGRNLAPLFRCHDRSQFEILCYSGVKKPDHFTEDFRRWAALWRNTVGVGNEALAEMIRQDGVDILVDLTQHAGGNRLPVFARKPAPVQVSFAGYPETAGMEAIGYRISDRHLEAEIRSPTKEQVCLLDSFWCYDPCGLEVPVNELPARENGRVTFGCLNNFSKINDAVLQRWARVLGKVVDSRLLLLSPEGSHRQWALDVLSRGGVEAQRVEFLAPRPRQAYLELYHRLDIVLDPFPYNGHTTSLDALWMGAPVVSLVGEVAVARGGWSQLSNLGLPGLAAFSDDDFVGIAVRLAGDLPRLAEMRATLRARMEASPLMDAPRFAHGLEAAYRSMWQAWCARES